MSVGKIIGWAIGGLVALLVVILIGVKLFVDPNDYKGRIAAAVHKSTGRELQLTGDIKLSVFPWIALELGPASLGNPPGFGAEPFLTFQHAAVRVKLLPLLSKQLEIARVELDGLDLRLHKNAAGKGNWQMSEEDKAAAAQPPPSPQSGSSTELKSIAGIKITHGRVAYDAIVIENIDLETGSIAAKAAIPVTLSFDANRGVTGERVDFKGELTLSEDTDAEQYQLAGLTLTGSVATPADSRPMDYAVSIPTLNVDLKQQTLVAPAFSLTLLDAKITGKLAGMQITDDLHLTGSLALAPLLLRDFATRFKIDLPKTKDAKALSALSMNTEFAYSAKGASLDNLLVKLDDTSLKGSLQYAGEKTTTVKFNLAADKIDLDRYRPPEGSTPPPKTAAAEQPKAKADGSAPMTLQGTFTLGAARVAGLDFTGIRATLDSQGNVARLSPSEAQLYGGKYSGDITYDTRKATPAITLDVHLADIDTAQLLANTKAKGRASGKANVNLKAAAQGAEADDILKTLDGQFDANLTDGAIEGLDIGYELARAQALLDKQSGTSVPNEHKTRFTSFKLSAPINDGVAQTKDLAIASSVLKVTGQGTINLPTTGIDMTLLASVYKNGGNTTAVDIPLKVTGNYTDPTVRPDLEGVVKGAVKQKLQDVLKKNGLDGLFKR